MFGLKNEEILTYLILVVIGYFIAKMFSRTCNGFSVGGKESNSSKKYKYDQCFIPNMYPSADETDFYVTNCNGEIWPWKDPVYCDPKWGSIDLTACRMTGNMGFDGNREFCVKRKDCRSTIPRGNNP